ncbi:hypothetical protein PAXRUDRAFT_368656 [Paxillus rubicundulus Ve08.2h10]|uniref:Uncharacterized protein n=1 Tax=Paxillus rubicundulus Ve08.2h10 TaxID=930991 RepID=A0A0D0DZ35_9AGAM|nr:hypothetical protein PAXRUDRAFT_368656 [Paxillus rubicundulus Ve08.2h10]
MHSYCVQGVDTVVVTFSQVHPAVTFCDGFHVTDLPSLPSFPFQLLYHDHEDPTARRLQWNLSTMESNADIQLSQADVCQTSPNISDTNIAVDHEDKLGTVPQVKKSLPLSPKSPDPHPRSVEPTLCPMMQGGDTKANDTGGRGSELSSRDCGSAFSLTPGPPYARRVPRSCAYMQPGEEPSHVRAMATPCGDKVDRAPICARFSNDPSSVPCSMTTEEETRYYYKLPVPSSIADVRCSGGTPGDNHILATLRGDAELAKYSPNLEALSLHANVASTVVIEPGAQEACSTDNSNYVRTSRAVLSNLEDNTRLSYYTHAHQQAIAGDLDCLGEDFPSSSAPPSSSPPQLFPSSPIASSQSSISTDDKIQSKETVGYL